MLGNQPSLSCYFLPLLQYLRPGYLPGLYRARLSSKYWQTADMLHLTLKVSPRWQGFMPGQHLYLTIAHNGRYVSRPFSICSPLSDWHSKRQISLCCKVSANGQFTPLLPTLASHSRVNISAAQGDFCWSQPAKSSVFIAAGAGITPIAAMLLSQRHWLAPVSLYYRVRGKENAALLQELKQLQKRNNLFQLYLSDSRTEPAADFTRQIIQAAGDNQFYLCGPAGFMQQITTALNAHGVASGRINSEQFGLAAALPAPVSDDAALSATFFQAGQAYQLAVLPQHSLLQSVEQQGLTPSFGCRMGVCLQCVCEKVSGQVRDMRSGLLSGHGSEQIQLCISQPVTELVIKL